MAEYNLADLFELSVDAFPDRRALIFEEERFTYRGLDERMNRMAHHLESVGIGPGDHVGIYSLNNNQWIETMYACYKIRAVPVNINFRYVEAELLYLFDNADLAALVYQRQYADRIAVVAGDVPTLRHFVRIEDGTDVDDSKLGPVEYEEALAAQSPERGFAERSPDDIYLLYTGGTTGMPKGVMWRQEDVFFALGGGHDPFTREPVRSPEELSQKAAAAGEDAAVLMFPVPPLMHGAGQFGCFNAFHNGYAVLLIAGFDAEAVWRLVAKERANTLSITGDAMARPLAETLETLHDELDLSSLLTLNSTAAVFSPSIKEQLLELLPNAMILDAVGSTEGGMNGMRIAEKGSKSEGGVTTVDPGPGSTVLDEDMKPVVPGSGTVGMLARSGNVPIGYYKDPEKTAATFPVVDGVRYSIPGDYATIDDDGRITLLGRGSVSINTGGEKVYPEEVEAALKSHPDVFDVLVVGVPDERWGERVAAVVQARGDTHPSVGELGEHCRQHIAGYKVPREVFYVDEVARLPNGKPDYTWAKETAHRLVGVDA
ncbi:MAG: acyl-CoA synthetase [Acidimicrobiia bacterium]